MPTPDDWVASCPVFGPEWGSADFSRTADGGAASFPPCDNGYPQWSQKAALSSTWVWQSGQVRMSLAGIIHQHHFTEAQLVAMVEQMRLPGGKLLLVNDCAVDAVEIFDVKLGALQD